MDKEIKIFVMHRSSRPDYSMVVSESMKPLELLRHLRDTFNCRFEIQEDENAHCCDLAILVQDDYD